MASPSLQSTKTLRAAPAKNRLCRLSAWQTPLIAGASTTICTRFISRAAPLCTNLDGNLCPTLTAHSEPLPFSELAETGSRQIIHISIRVLGWKCVPRQELYHARVIFWRISPWYRDAVPCLGMKNWARCTKPNFLHGTLNASSKKTPKRWQKRLVRFVLL